MNYSSEYAAPDPKLNLSQNECKENHLFRRIKRGSEESDQVLLWAFFIMVPTIF